jgi:[CysO sulfur-carrier protein]-S-L-cysteine hydrolase
VVVADLLEELLAHAREEAPNECCGVVAFAPGQAEAHIGDSAASGDSVDSGSPAQPARRAVRVFRATNTAASPLRFEIDGREVLSLIDAIERDGCELGAIYHSHTRTAPYPSQTDINFAANWPGVEWIIVGLANPRAPEIRSYLIDGGRVEEVEI